MYISQGILILGVGIHVEQNQSQAKNKQWTESCARCYSERVQSSIVKSNSVVVEWLR